MELGGLGMTPDKLAETVANAVASRLGPEHIAAAASGAVQVTWQQIAVAALIFALVSIFGPEGATALVAAVK